MTKEEMRRLQAEIHEYLVSLRRDGQAEYAHSDQNAFANFERVAEQLGLDRKEVLWVYLSKHMDGIAAAIQGHMSQREPIYGRLGDVMVYIELLYGMFLEDEKARMAAEAAGRELTLNRPVPVRNQSNVRSQSQIDQPPGRVDNAGGGLGMRLAPIVDPGSSVGHESAPIVAEIPPITDPNDREPPPAATWSPD